jgi:uncharacterized protein CbrC (UPF0167 family)
MTLDLTCGCCGQPLTFTFKNWQPESRQTMRQAWTCPWCKQDDETAFPGMLVSVTARLMPDPSDTKH